MVSFISHFSARIQGVRTQPQQDRRANPDQYHEPFEPIIVGQLKRHTAQYPASYFNNIGRCRVNRLTTPSNAPVSQRPSSRGSPR